MKMRHLLSGLTLAYLNAYAHLALAADELPDATKSCESDNWSYCNPLWQSITSIPSAGKTIVSYLLGLLSTIGLFFLVYAGIVYITAAGDEKKVAQAKTIITYTIVGLAVALLTYSLLQTIMDILKVQ
jgi:hypothetical protein